MSPKLNPEPTSWQTRLEQLESALQQLRDELQSGWQERVRNLEANVVALRRELRRRVRQDPERALWITFGVGLAIGVVLTAALIWRHPD
ncbi:MAG: hypothetical protein N2561_10060 [Bacteroidetes bacterium]|nr:hypothetical protein [Rhodothermia bacterium]MCX7907861.1 hypothetical protein [Bacteroidota bacterium]MDW8284734.1 hypothetical protein [Bacteroidota bacterium]